VPSTHRRAAGHRKTRVSFGLRPTASEIVDDRPAERAPSPTDLAPDARPPEVRAVLDGLLEHLLNGVAYCRMEYADGQPSDFLFLYTNPAFHTQTGLAGVRGQRISQIVPALPQTDAALLEIFGRVARGGPPETFEIFVKSMAQWFSVSVYCPQPEHFVALFDVVTERKKAEAALEDRARQLRFVLEGSELGFWDWDIATGKVERNPHGATCSATPSTNSSTPPSNGPTSSTPMTGSAPGPRSSTWSKGAANPTSSNTACSTRTAASAGSSTRPR
jgi:PAS domain-containing protein